MEIYMSFNEDKISIEHEGQKYSATYIVEGGVVSVMMKDSDGKYNGTSTFVNGSPVNSVARSLFCELLKDIGLI